MITSLLQTLKIKHYIKNFVVIIPIIFSMNFLNALLWLKIATIFVAFCLISSAVYIMNDLIDIKKDQLHPIKKNRPIAKGLISKKLALFTMSMLILVSSILSLKLNLLSFLMIASYFLLNIFYSFYLKNIPIIDAVCIAVGFILRVVSGCFAINVIPSPLVILLTFFISMFFTFSKRKLEIRIAGNICRESLKSIDIEMANQLVLINAILSISFYFTYVMDKTTIERAGTHFLYLTVIPFTLIIFRLLLLINTKTAEDDPLHLLEKDKQIKYLFLFYLITLTFTMTLLK